MPSPSTPHTPDLLPTGDAHASAPQERRDKAQEQPHTASSTQFPLRPATMDDAEAIRNIRNTAIRTSLALWTTTELTLEQTQTWLAPQVQRGTVVVSVDEAGAVVGFACASPWSAYEGYARTVEGSIYLDSAAQGHGIGSRLFAALIRACQAAGDRTMVALIESENTASIRLHEKYGFTMVGTIPAAGEKFGQTLDLTLMSRSLIAE